MSVWSRFNILIASSPFEVVPSSQSALTTSTVSRRDTYRVFAVVPVIADGVLGP